MKNFSYEFEKYTGRNSRHICPGCQHPHTLTRYINRFTGEEVSPEVGICDRVNKCGYHFTPKEYYQLNNLPLPVLAAPAEFNPVIIKPPSFIPQRFLESSKQAFARNNFVIFLNRTLGEQKSKQVVESYQIGTSKYWPGATIFWQIGQDGKVHTGKVMLYDKESGKRIPKHVNWVHTFINDPQFRVQQCLFGEHLLKSNPQMPVAVVESEKSAIIASTYFPQFVWLACGGITQLNAGKCKVLQGRKIILIPDTDGYMNWTEVALKLKKELNQTFFVSDLLENMARTSEREAGWDIADYLIAGRFNELVGMKN